MSGAGRESRPTGDAAATSRLTAAILAAGRDGREAEGARLESVCRGNSTVGSNPTLSANYKSLPFNNLH
jgi:hypothetical protein